MKDNDAGNMERNGEDKEDNDNKPKRKMIYNSIKVTPAQHINFGQSHFPQKIPPKR